METSPTIVLVATWLFFCGGILWHYRLRLLACWREPMLKRPVLIIESDDWGPGPEGDARDLNRLAEHLRTFADRDGNPPVMTLGVVLALPDSRRIRIDRGAHYHRLTLGDQRFAPIVDAMLQGRSAGVFALQLHGMEHFWPEAIMKAARSDDAIRVWMTEQELPDAQSLPSPLQSRWTDASGLPSAELSPEAIAGAVSEEVGTFAAVFGSSPRVVVPPTFVWSSEVERAWAEAGVVTLITPGRQFTVRDRTGRPAAPAKRWLVNGQRGEGRIRYLVRDIYFEPALQHTAEQCLKALADKVRLARPALVETHRFNFATDDRTAEQSFRELDRLLRGALTRYPELLFMSSERLSTAIAERDGALLETNMRKCLSVWLERLREIPRLSRLAWISGLIFPYFILKSISKSPSSS
jgi:hypothetical protein